MTIKGRIAKLEDKGIGTMLPVARRLVFVSRSGEQFIDKTDSVMVIDPQRGLKHLIAKCGNETEAEFSRRAAEELGEVQL